MDRLTGSGRCGISNVLQTKAIRVVIAVMMALALVPTVSVAQAFAAQPKFIGSVYYPVAYDDNGYPLYNEDGTFKRGDPYVTLSNVENASGTLVVPATFDVVERAQDGTEKIERNVMPAEINFGNGKNSWTNSAITSIDATQCTLLENVRFNQLATVESINLSSLQKLNNVSYQDCSSLRLANMDDCLSLTIYDINGCVNLALPDFSQAQWHGLEYLTIQNRPDLTSLDVAHLSELNHLYIFQSGLTDINISGCSRLESLYLPENSLTKLDVGSIPASVVWFDCTNNAIEDTEGLVARFGESSVLPQNINQASGLFVVDERVARGAMVPNESYYFGLSGAYRPGSLEIDNYRKEDERARTAASNFTVSSSDSSVATIEITEEDYPQARVETLRAGTTTITASYSFTGVYGTYTGQQVIDFTVVASANPITSIICASSVEAPIVTKCALCGKNHADVNDGSSSMLIPVEITTQDPNRPPTASNHIEVTSADESIAVGSLMADPVDLDSEYALFLTPRSLGSTTLTFVAVTAGNGIPEPIRTELATMQVNVVESPGPKLEVTDKLTFGNYGDGFTASIVTAPDYMGNPSVLSKYVDNVAYKQTTRWHYNGFSYGHTVTTDNGKVQVVTAVSDNEKVASVSYEHGAMLELKGPGTAHVTVSDVWGNTGTCTVTVLDRAAEAQKLSLSQDEISIKVGEAIDLSTLVQGMDKLDPYFQGASEFLVFKGNNGYVAPIKYNEKRYVSQLYGRNVGDVTITAGVLNGNDMGGSLEYIDQWKTTDFGTLTVHVVPSDTPTNPATGVEVTGASNTVEMGSSLQLSADITPADADNADTLAWSSSDEAVATVDASGKVTPVTPGKATITAAVGAVSGTFEVTVVEKSIPATGVSISTTNDAMQVGDTQKLTATVEPADSTDKVVWASTDETVLAVDQDGLVTAVGNGTAAIQVSAGSVKAETGAIAVTTPVSGVSLDKQALELYVGAEASQLVATVAPATASDQSVSWKSSDTAVATVDEDGNVAPVAPGTATVTATTTDGAFAASCVVTVKQHVEGIALDARELTLTGVQTAPLKATVSPDNATNKGVTWATSDEGVATVDIDGKVSAVGKGTATITATTEDGAFTATCTVTVKNPAIKLALDPAALALVKGETAATSPMLTGELGGEVDEIGALTWTSSNEAVATVADGEVTAVSSGAATISAEAMVGESKLTGTCTVTVTNPVQSVTLSDTSKTVTVGDAAFALSATVSPSDADDIQVAWTSSNPQTATVDKDGRVTVLSAGSASIVASAGGKSAVCSLTVASKMIAATPEGSGFAASVTASDSATVEALNKHADDGLNLVVQAIASLTAPAKGAIEKLTADGAVVAEQFDIHFAKDSGEEIVLSADEGGTIRLTVKVKLTDSMRALLDQGMSLQVHYVGEDGAIEDKQTWVEGDFLCFTTEHFSDYVVTGVPPKDEGGQGAGGVGSDDGNQTLTMLPTGNGTSLAPTGDPLGAVVLAVGALACLAALVTCREKK